MAERQPLEIQFYKLSETAFAPQRYTPGSAGYDLRSPHQCVVLPGQQLTVFTDLVMIIPDGNCGKLYNRSGLAQNSCVHVAAGVIDSDYRGNVGIILMNTSPTAPFHIARGMKIAQIVLEPVVSAEFKEVPIPVQVAAIQGLATGKGTHGSSGFGSSGLF